MHRQNHIKDAVMSANFNDCRFPFFILKNQNHLRT